MSQTHTDPGLTNIKVMTEDSADLKPTSILVGEKWVVVEAFLRIPSKANHDFANITNEKAHVLNLKDVYSIVKWSQDNYK